jgi:hypothetical protein
MYIDEVVPSILASTGFFLVVFLVLCKPAGLGLEKACQLTSLTHHVIAAALGMYSTYAYYGSISASALARNSNFPWADTLQRFNIGYFLYDLGHAITWEHNFIVHHLIALAGVGSSEYSGVFALSNAVNIWITEIGSLFYNVYVAFKSKKNYTRFVIIYSASRLVFFAWSLHVLYQVWNREALFLTEYPFWAPACAAVLQMLLLVVNLWFLSVHIRKLLKQLREDSKNHTD